MSCCAVNCTNRFSRDVGIGFYTIPAKVERREAWLRAISRAGWEAKSSDRLCGEHFVSGRPSRDPSNIDYVPTIFKDGKRRANCSMPDQDRRERSAKRAKVREEEEDRLTAAEGLLHMSAMASSCGDASRDASTQTDHAFPLLDPSYLVPPNQDLSVKVAALQEELVSLKQSLPPSPLQLMANSNQKTKFYTGLPTYEVFVALFHYLEPQVLSTRQKETEPYAVARGRKRKLDLNEEFLAVLMRLRLGLLVEDAADRFAISPATMSKIFTTWIKVMSKAMKVIFPWPSREQVHAVTPKKFAPFPSTRVIIDCTEFYIQRPSSLNSQVDTFSFYKSHNTFKLLIGISPGGVITFVSELWGGRVSDKAITQSSGLLERLDPGDNIMADRGFDLEDVLAPKGITINIPPFLGSDRKQLSRAEVEQTRRIAGLRIHVERAIGRIKQYKLIQGVLPITLASLANDIICVCAYLTNFLPPIVSDDSSS